MIIFIGLSFLFLFSIVIPFSIDKVSSQSDTLTDSDTIAFYSNPSGYVNKKVEFTGQVKALLHPHIEGVHTFQMYQAGDINRNTLVSYTIDPIYLREGDCVKVIGLTQPPVQYEDFFKGVHTAFAIKAESVTKIDCSES